ncbi:MULTISPECIES: hypothetical protein [Antarcticibacterium]|nr:MULTISPECIES: hypothetical protein [Antarcticibacterium]
MKGETKMKQMMETRPAGAERKPGKLVYNHRSACLIFHGWKRYEEAEEEE